MTNKEFIDSYMPLGEALYRVAFYLLESRDDAEDAVQDLYLKLWNSRKSLSSVKNPKAYCITLMKNICIDRIRKASRAELGELDENIKSCGETDDRTIGKETARHLAQAMQNLPRKQQEVLKMRIFEELSNDEISQRTGMGNLTVRVLLSQARKTLRKVL